MSRELGRLVVVAFVLGLHVSASGQTPLTEARVLELAVARNPGLRASMLELESAELLVDSEVDRYEPMLLLDAGVTRTESPSLTPTGTSTNGGTTASTGAAVRKAFPWGTSLTLRLGGTYQLTDARSLSTTVGSFDTPALGPGYGLNARLTLAQPLLRGAGREVGEADLRAARARRTTAERSRDRVASELVRSALSAYWDLWLAHSSLAIEERSRALAVAQRDEAKARADSGSLAPASVLAFETALAVREEGVLVARTGVEQRRATLRQRIGVGGAAAGSGAGDALLGEPVELVPPEVPAPVADARARALRESPVVHERASAVALAETQASTAEEPLRPRLDLEAYLQADGLGNEDLGAAAEGLGTLQAVSAHVGLLYEGPFSADRKRNAAARARIAIEVARAQLDEAKQSVLAEVDVALAGHAAETERVKLAQRTVEIARQQLTAEQERLAAGASTPLSVVQAEEDLRDAELRVAQARAALIQTALTLDHLTGRLLARHASRR
jgi:outer membrane protein TolC